MPKQDAGYKLLFSNPILVRDFLDAFYPYSKDARTEFPQIIQRISGSWIDERKMLRKDNDIAWICSVRRNDQNHKFVLLIEFQTHPDSIMPVRLNSYGSLLFEELYRSKKIKTAKLPLIFPVVLYNGIRPWTAPTKVEEALEQEPSELRRWQPQLEYLLVDQLNLLSHQLPSAKNLAGLLIRIERSQNPAQATRWLRQLTMRLNELKEINFQKSLVSWLTHSFLPTRMPDIELRDLETIEQIIMSIENNTMDWSVQYIEQGLEQGRAEGRAEGRAAGREEGLSIGIEKGKLSGLAEGQAKLIIRLLSKKFGPNIPVDVYAKIEAADIGTLERISDSLLDLNSLNELENLLK